MKTDIKFDTFIKDVEGCTLHVYKDSKGLPTIGVGHLLLKSELEFGNISIGGISVSYKNGITEEQALALLDQDATQSVNCVNSNVKVPLTQDQFNACVSLTFNIGTHGFATSHVLIYINSNQFDKVPDAFRMWNKPACIISRREKEVQLWEGKL
jgi:lysozyme